MSRKVEPWFPGRKERPARIPRPAWIAPGYVHGQHPQKIARHMRNDNGMTAYYS